MEFFGILFFTLVGITFLWSLLFAIIGPIWLRRVQSQARTNKARLSSLERENADLRATLEGRKVSEVEAEVEAEVGAEDGASSSSEAAEGLAAPAPSDVEAGSAGVLPADSLPPEGETFKSADETPALPAVEALRTPGPEPLPSPLSPLSPLSPPSPPPSRVEWERWVGVRGAAVLGGMVLALAGFLFLKFSIEQGLIPPIVRVALGLLVGVGCIVGSEALRRRREDYQATANSLAGAGVVLLYAAVWAARVLYGLIGSGPAFALMILVTVACGVLSWRYRSMVIAVLGLVGGFATPALLSTGSDHPIGLFGYLLMLDGGVLLLAAKRRWPALAAISLGLTVLYQAAWIFDRMGGERLFLGLGIVALFAAAYGVAGGVLSRRGARLEGEGQGLSWLMVQAAAVFLPFTFALYFVGNTDLGPHLYPTAALLLLLTLLAHWVGNDHKQPLFGIAAAAGDVAVLVVWCMVSRLETTALVWEVVVSGLALALVCHVFAELKFVGSCRSAGLVAVGLLLLFVLVSLDSSASWTSFFWPWLVGWVGLALLLCRQAVCTGDAQRQVLAAVGLGLGLGLYFLAHGASLVWPVLFCGLGGAVAFQALALLRGTRYALAVFLASAKVGEAAAALPLVLLTVLALGPKGAVDPGLFLGITLALALLTALAATQQRSGTWYFAATALLASNHWLWSRELANLPDPAETALLGLAIQSSAVVLFTAWPFLTGKSLVSEPWAWYATALAGPTWFFSLKILFVACFGDSAIGILPVALGALALTAAFRARQLWTVEETLGRSRLVWFAAVALGFGSLAIPLQLEKEWITLGWALLGFAVTVLWKRLDHPGLKYFALALLGATTMRLVANPALLDYYPRGG